MKIFDEFTGFPCFIIKYILFCYPVYKQVKTAFNLERLNL